MDVKKWISKNGLPLLGLGLAALSTIVNNKNNEKAMEETITKRVDKVLSDKMKDSLPCIYRTANLNIIKQHIAFCNMLFF